MQNSKNSQLGYLITENLYLFLATMLSISMNIAVLPWVPKDINLVEKFTESYKLAYKPFVFVTLVTYLILFGINKIYPNIESIKKIVTIRNIISSIITLLLVFICIFNFSIFKHTIPLINPFSWDPLLFRADMMLLGNKYPADLMNNLLPRQNLKHLSDICYASWAIISGLMLFWQNISPARKLRMQFLLAWLLSWIILGSICALFFSSAGPCFYDVFYTSTPKAIMLANKQLQQHSADYLYLTDAAKSMLLQTTQNKSFANGFGISAFPSLHVAISVLNAIVISKYNKYIGYIGWGYVLAISLSCVYLGFHYLVDCIAAIVGAYFIWALAGRALNNLDKKIKFDIVGEDNKTRMSV